MAVLTYKDAGVDINKAERALHAIRHKIHNTHTPQVLNFIGGFASLTEIPGQYKNPVMASSTDGVGTKLKIAFQSGKHDTVGIDLVAMSVNDILTMGAKPYFFLDYFAAGRLEEKVYQDVISGICDGCRIAGCALIGGETAEMPSFYKDGEYDLAGFAIGFVERDRIVDGSRIKPGDTIIALPSSGLHSNGFSLVRKALFEIHNLNIHGAVEGIEGKLYEELLKPTRIYVNPVLQLLEKFDIKGMAHITGGGIPGNISRILPDGVIAQIELPEALIPPIFRLIARLGNVALDEMCSTFNMGLGFILVVNAADGSEVLQECRNHGLDAFVAGVIEKSSAPEKVSVTIC
jgi:phosphoribosylformylglycinamidine cyclo-ligase